MTTKNADPAARMESAVAKAVDGRSEYQKPLLTRLNQMARRYDHMADEIARLKERERRLADFLSNAVHEGGRIRDIDAARDLLED